MIDLEERKSTFNEVEIGFNKEQALAEANRCLQCANPVCVQGCPAKVNIPGFIKAFREGNIEEAGRIIRERDLFPSVCGRICQHELQCEGNCILAKTGEPINIGGIERFIGDNTKLEEKPTLNGKRVAVIGSGPSGLTVASLLALNRINVKVFDVSHAFGGVIKYGVPEFRLPKNVVNKELVRLNEMGIEFEPNSKVDEESLEEFAKQFDAVFLGTGVGKPRKLIVPGSELKGIMSALTFLVNLNQSQLPAIKPEEKVVIVGAGYVGIDAARSAIRLGADVTCVTIANREDALKAISQKDLLDAEEEGVKFLFGVRVDSFEGKDFVQKVHYTNGSTGSLEATKIIIAIGQEHANDSFKKQLLLKKDGCIEVMKNHRTSIENVFAAGDCVHGPKTVIEAIDKGREAAESMLKYLNENKK